MDIQFEVNLIKVAENQTDEAKKNLEINCTYVDKNYWTYEGDLWWLEDVDGVKFEAIGIGIVPSLGDMNKTELIQLVNDIFEIDLND